jgi:PAP2 superfamily
MLARARTLQARLLPHGVVDALRQVAIFALAYYGYRLVRGAADGRTADAFSNARSLIDIERSLHLFVEPAMQSWAQGSQLLVDAASWVYINAQTSVTLSALIYLYLFRNSSFYFVRNMMVVSMGLALIGYIAYPTAPPRFFPEWGFSDSVAEFTGVRSDSVTVNALFNPYAAVPSMHVAFALMIGWPLAKLVKWRALKVFWALYPLIVTLVIVVTANHFIADAVLGACTAAVAAYTAHWLARARPAAWAFGARAGAPA